MSVNRHSHSFTGGYSVRHHLNVDHGYLESGMNDSAPTSELMAIHRELHLLRTLEPPALHNAGVAK